MYSPTATLPTSSTSAGDAIPTARRPELRLAIDSRLAIAPSAPPTATDTPSDTGDSPSPAESITDDAPPTSSVTSDSPHVSGVAGYFLMPPAHPQTSHLAPGNMHVAHPPPHLLPDPLYRFPSANIPDRVAHPATMHAPPVGAPRRLAHSSSLDSGMFAPSGPSSSSSTRAPLAHPYARIYAKKAAAPTVKRRKMWNHALEKSLFTPEEIATLGAPNRRAIYTASLENHIDQLHNQLLALGLFPVSMETLESYRGLNSKTAKSMVAGLHKDACDMKTKLMELERATQALYRDGLVQDQGPAGDSVESAASQARRHSVATTAYVYPNFFAPSGSSATIS